MLKRVLIATVVAAVAAGPVSANDRIYDLIERGKLDEARRELSQVSTAALRNGTNLFYQALLEPDGDKSAQLMEIALNSSVSSEYRELIFLRLAQYYYFSGRFEKLERLIVDYRVSFESGQYRAEILRYSSLVDEHRRAWESALRQVDRYLIEYSSGEAEQWGHIDKARVLLANSKEIGAQNLLRRLSKKDSGPGVPQALYLLTRDAVLERRADDAVFYYNLLREAYPAAVGLDALVADLAEMSEARKNTGSEAEKLTGTFYSVQVGVFSEEDNAREMAKLFEKYGYPVDVRDKSISNIKYRVVYVGRFSTYAEAAATKTKLEVEHNEVFPVVAR
jgi:hypothetical protein